MEYKPVSEIPEGFSKVCRISQLNERQGKRFFVNDTDVALFKVDGEVYALSNVCPHQHSSIIFDGILDGDYIVCPSHGWKFSLKTGRQPTGYKGLDIYEVLLIDNDVYVKAARKELKW